jgi:hypothetical protein
MRLGNIVGTYVGACCLLKESSKLCNSIRVHLIVVVIIVDDSSRSRNVSVNGRFRPCTLLILLKIIKKNVKCKKEYWLLTLDVFCDDCDDSFIRLPLDLDGFATFMAAAVAVAGVTVVDVARGG